MTSIAVIIRNVRLHAVCARQAIPWLDFQISYYAEN
jgi:hypothetical protein